MYIKTAKYSGGLSAVVIASHLFSHGYIGAENYVSGLVTEGKNRLVNQAADTLGLEPKRLPEAITEAKTPAELVANACALEGVNPQLAIAMMHQESNGDVWAESPKGAIGLMQVMPANAKACGLSNPGELWIPEKNAQCGCRMAKALLQKYDIVDALRAYNAGEGNMRKGFRETETYTKRVMQKFIALLTLQARA